MDVLLKVLNPDTWAAALGPQRAGAAAAAITKDIARGARLSHMMQLLHLIPLHQRPPPSKSLAEVVVAQLLVRWLATCGPKPAAAGGAPLPLAGSKGTSLPVEGLLQLLCCPGLWERCSALVPVAGR